eukprot:scaffold137113_cov27-Tisochrysis_lutea.AAC.1
MIRSLRHFRVSALVVSGSPLICSPLAFASASTSGWVCVVFLFSLVSARRREAVPRFACVHLSASLRSLSCEFSASAYCRLQSCWIISTTSGSFNISGLIRASISVALRVGAVEKVATTGWWSETALPVNKRRSTYDFCHLQAEKYAAA